MDTTPSTPVPTPAATTNSVPGSTGVRGVVGDQGVIATTENSAPGATGVNGVIGGQEPPTAPTKPAAPTPAPISISSAVITPVVTAITTPGPIVATVKQDVKNTETQVLSFWTKAKHIFLKYILPAGIIILTILEVISFVSGGKGFSWIGKLKFGGKKKLMDIAYKQAVNTVAVNDQKIAAIQQKIAANDGDIAQNKQTILQLQQQQTQFNKEVDDAKSNVDSLNKLVISNL